MKIVSYIHKVKYYETDQMGIVHHSNYVRWMEEARVEFLRENGINYKTLEQEGIMSPVVSVCCDYKHPAEFDDEVKIDVHICQYGGVKLTFEYKMTNAKNGKLLCSASSGHCFLSEKGKVLILSKSHPHYHELLETLSK